MVYKKALKIAYNAHKGQFRDDGITSYIIHPIRVANIFSDDFRKTIAVLHDIVEDTDITLIDLKKKFRINFLMGGGIIYIVNLLTRRKDEKYFNYIKRLSKNKTAVEIKIADVIDNLSDRLCSESMMKRYDKTLDILINKNKLGL